MKPAADCPQVHGGLAVHIHPVGDRLMPPAELLLTDPKGRRTGLDPVARRSHQEIPNSVYEFEGLDDDEAEEPGPSTGVVEIWCNPEEGTYSLDVIGTSEGEYELELTAHGTALKTSSRTLPPAPISKGTSHRYAIQYSKRPGAKLRVEKQDEQKP